MSTIRIITNHTTGAETQIKTENTWQCKQNINSVYCARKRVKRKERNTNFSPEVECGVENG